VSAQPSAAHKQYKLALVCVCLLSVGVLGRLEYVWGPRGDLEPCYLIPIVLLTWYGGRVAMALGIGSSLLAGYLATHLSGRWATFSGVAAWNGMIRLALFVSATVLVAAFRATWEREKRLARMDGLTRVANRRSFLELAEGELRRARRYQHAFTLAYVDLDDFKRINDRFGHHAGDQVLLLVAETLRSGVRSTDIVARLGGDEFAILLPETSDVAAQQVLFKLRTRLSEKMTEQSWPVSCSIGAATFVQPGVSVEEMLKVADGLLYEVKRNGKNCIRHEVCGDRAALTQEAMGAR
jgi:diguanylate cyclase (GGDEF)-like protein